MTCQDRVDTKAFKGKGPRAKLRHLESEVDRLESHMAELIAVSKQMHSVHIYLALHRRLKTGYVFLRWRQEGGDKRHLSWDAARGLYSEFPAHIRRWYANLTDLAMEDNAAHVQLRKEIRVLRRQIRQAKPEIYPKSLPQKDADED